ncbi:hypothetical protein [Beijerinckia sp. L45]|uniref:hypothetical protein n=1 Tax=Beijerinckia sp. L45 TaxID=1641855 RepID=UPI00131ACD58|nr:hypothetical protein [Beijerinckia sp. L45]
MLTSVFEKSSFDPAQAAILTNAYTQAVIAVGGVYIIDAAAQIKLAKIILAIATKRIKAGGKVETHMDAESIATLASTRFLHLLADDPVQAYAS